LEKRIYQEAEMNYFILKDRLIKKLLEIKRLYMRDKGLFQLKERVLGNPNQTEIFPMNIPIVDTNTNVNEGFKPVIVPGTQPEFKNLVQVQKAETNPQNKFVEIKNDKLQKTEVFRKNQVSKPSQIQNTDSKRSSTTNLNKK
jgi:hypothetical protein